MPVRYRCPGCDQLLSIATRMIGQIVPCPRCQLPTTVPAEDDPFFLAPPPLGSPEPEASRAAAEPPAVPAGVVSPPSPAVENVAAPPARAEMTGSSPPAAAVPVPGGFRLRRRGSEVDEMDLTPMVDMTFLLLIFFMITASFSLQKSLEVPPPSPDQKGAAQTLQSLEDLENRSIIVRITDDNLILVDDQPVADRARLAETLQSLRTADRNELVLSAADAAFHETVVAVIDAANEAGLQKIRLATRAAGG